MFLQGEVRPRRRDPEVAQGSGRGCGRPTRIPLRVQPCDEAQVQRQADLRVAEEEPRGHASTRQGQLGQGDRHAKDRLRSGRAALERRAHARQERLPQRGHQVRYDEIHAT